MLSNRQAALSFILEDEGDELNIGGSEPGGGSRYGLSIAFLTDYRRKQGQPAATIADLKALTSDSAGQIYSDTLLAPIRFDELPAGVDYRLADITTNLGLTGGPTALQLALGMWPLTGAMDDATMAAVKAAEPMGLVKALSAVWIATKHTSPNWNPSPITKSGYGHGWSNRNARATARALAMVTT